MAAPLKLNGESMDYPRGSRASLAGDLVEGGARAELACHAVVAANPVRYADLLGGGLVAGCAVLSEMMKPSRLRER
jgi:hypothetical protein